MGRVVYGRQLGRSIGVPTVNIRLRRHTTALAGVFWGQRARAPPTSAFGRP